MSPVPLKTFKHWQFKTKWCLFLWVLTPAETSVTLSQPATLLKQMAARKEQLPTLKTFHISLKFVHYSSELHLHLLKIPIADKLKKKSTRRAAPIAFCITDVPRGIVSIALVNDSDPTVLVTERKCKVMLFFTCGSQEIQPNNNSLPAWRQFLG